MKSMKVPLAIYVAYSQLYKEGNELYGQIYRWLCRNSRKPLSNGLNIPVYYTNGVETQFDESRAERIAILLLIDSNMWRDQSWRKKVIEWEKKVNDQFMVIPVKLCKDAFDFCGSVKHLQFITLDTFSISENWERFQLRVYDCLIRFLSNDPEKKLKIFISHSKRDDDNKGEKLALELKNFLQSETKLDVFFDVNDNLDANPFDASIYKGLETSAVLIMLFTNTYSSREWCRKEIISAKKCKIPVCGVSAVDGNIDRILPYIGNIPCTVYDKSWLPIINLALRTVLDQSFERKLLGEIQQGGTEIVPFAPEVISLQKLNSKTIILYPEPPLGEEELNLLRDIHPNAICLTAMEYLAKEIDLHNSNVAVSISEGQDMDTLGIGIDVLNDMIVEVSKHILKANGRLVYGGDLREMGFTELFSDLSEEYGKRVHADALVTYFTDYLAWPMTLNLDQEKKDDFIRHRVDLVPVDCADTVPEKLRNCKVDKVNPWHMKYSADSLTKMRKQMEENVQARIIAGGKSYGFSGHMAGIVEEFKYAIQFGHPIYLIGGFGGAAKIMADILTGVKSFEVLDVTAQMDGRYSQLQKIDPTDYSWLDGLNIQNLKNGLDENENRVLLNSSNVMEIVSLILKGLKASLS